MRRNAQYNKPNYSPLAIVSLVLTTIALCACAFFLFSIATNIKTIASPPTTDIVLPDDITDVRLSTTREEERADGSCFHLIRRKDGQPDYIVGPCR